MTAEGSSPASRLCAACGMCCDGTLFYSAVLQPEDSERDLKTLGLRLKYKKKQAFLPQPCSAFRGNCCSIYQARPQRCRLFNCRQLLKVESGESTETQARTAIDHARLLVGTILDLLPKAGSTNLNRSLRTRYEFALAQPLDEITDPSASKIRDQLVQNMEELEEILAAEFRV